MKRLRVDVFTIRELPDQALGEPSKGSTANRTCQFLSMVRLSAEPNIRSNVFRATTAPGTENIFTLYFRPCG